MLKLFKSLASISVWVLFICGAGGVVWSTIDSFTRSGGMAGEPYNFSDVAWFTSSVVSLFLAVVAMKIRKDLE